MTTKDVFKTATTMHQEEEKLVANMVTLNLRCAHSGEFNGQIFGASWNALLEFWKNKKRLALKHNLPQREIKS